ncbi:HMA2 domain-containing protein [Microcoleus sp. FACHB-672]|uniref:HMA2 domain-containing protein n=1 Tax=Microcoleus sp. FACHB-672 TaxID=2692825 RepID=UPI001687734E|nr:hypothetical protein [Microcoleus sp. FACHB-672]MBD2043334.1 hypothetical protein [Microcoleus sp. FACHB-672]
MTELNVQCPQTGLQIVHAIPGRLRLRAVGSASESALETVAQRLRQQEGIYKVNINLQTGSLLATFDENRLPLQQLLGMLKQKGVSVAPSPSEDLPLPELWEPVSAALSATQLDSAIPLIVGMLITQRLGIQGLPAIPLYLIAAGTTRQVIDEQGITGLIQQPLIAESSTQNPTSEIQHRLVHAVPGRLRFHVPRLADDAVYTRRIERLIESAAGVTGVRVNQTTASLIVSYKAGSVSLLQMQSRLEALIEQAKVAGLPKIPQPAEDSTSVPEPASEMANAAVPYNGRVQHSPQPAPEPALAVSNGRVQTLPPRSMAVSPVSVKILKKLVLTDTSATRKKPSFWDSYKPPALKASLAFLANLY